MKLGEKCDYGEFQNTVSNKLLADDPENTETLRVGVILAFKSQQTDLRIQGDLQKTVEPNQEFKLLFSGSQKTIFFRDVKTNQAIMFQDGKLFTLTAGQVCELIRIGKIQLISPAKNS